MHVSFASHRALAASLWRFSLALYSRSGVAHALLTLQEHDGLDVNIALFSLWLGAVRGTALSADLLSEAHAAIDQIRRAVVLPLRELRRALGAGPLADIRAQVSNLELVAERAAQSCLAEVAISLASQPQWADRMAVARANLAVCLGHRHECAEADVLRRELAALMRRS